MTQGKIELYQRVALTRDLPEHNLCKGDVAVVVEYLPGTSASGGEDGYALEVFNAVGETIAVIIVPVSAVKPLTENEIFQVRPLSTGRHNYAASCPCDGASNLARSLALVYVHWIGLGRRFSSAK